MPGPEGGFLRYDYFYISPGQSPFSVVGHCRLVTGTRMLMRQMRTKALTTSEIPGLGRRGPPALARVVHCAQAVGDSSAPVPNHGCPKSPGIGE